MAQAKNTKNAENSADAEDQAPENETPEDQTPEEGQHRDDGQDDSGDDGSGDDDSGDAESGERSGGRQRKKRLTAKGAIRRSIEQLEELTGRTPESIIAVDRQEDGWKVTLELVESRRIPDTTDILAEYSATIDDRGELTGYRREARYTRGRVDG